MPKRSKASLSRASDPADKLRFRTCSLAARELWRELRSTFRPGPGDAIDLHPTRLARLLGADVEEVLAAVADLLGSGLVSGSVSSERIELKWPPREVERPGAVGAGADQRAAADQAGADVPRSAGPATTGRGPDDPVPRPRGGRGLRGTRRGSTDGAQTPRHAPKSKDNKNKKKRLSSSDSSGPLGSGAASEAADLGAGAIGPARGLTWSRAGGWSGIDRDDILRWRDAYPEVDIDRQLSRMNAWLHANPAKTRRSDWERFIVNWLKREVGPGQRSSPAPGVGPQCSTPSGPQPAPAVTRRALERAKEFPEPNLLSKVVIGGPTRGAATLTPHGEVHEKASAA